MVDKLFGKRYPDPVIDRSESDILLEGSVSSLQQWCERENLVAASAGTTFLQAQTWATAGTLVAGAEPAIHRYVAILAAAFPKEAIFANRLLHLEVATVCATGWMGVSKNYEVDIAVGLAAGLRTWLLELKSSGQLPTLQVQAIVPPHAWRRVEMRPEAITYLVSAALDQDIEEQHAESYRHKLERIRSTLGLKPAELARLLSVTPEAVRQWRLGGTIAKERWPEIDQLSETVRKLTGFFKPEALPSIVRRRSPGLQNRTPLDWLASKNYDGLLTLYQEVFTNPEEL